MAEKANGPKKPKILQREILAAVEQDVCLKAQYTIMYTMKAKYINMSFHRTFFGF
jgi:hypothetical protein